MHCEQTSDNGPLLCFLWDTSLDSDLGLMEHEGLSSKAWLQPTPGGPCHLPPKILKHPNVPFLGFLPHFAGTPAPVASWDQAAWEVHRFTAYRFAKPLVCPSEIKWAIEIEAVTGRHVSHYFEYITSLSAGSQCCWWETSSLSHYWSLLWVYSSTS